MLRRSGIQTFKRFQGNIGAGSDPDYSITPTTYSYQLPIKNEPEDHIRVSASPLSIMFEMTGVSTSTSNYNTNLEQYSNYPLTNFKHLRKLYGKKKAGERPVNVKMTSKDFIDDSLYNPQYGYFNKDVEIFKMKEPFDYGKLASGDEFLRAWEQKYEKYNSFKQNLQLWHTPTELFQPYYGEAVARYILSHHNINEPLVIYEMGAGNGTLMDNILSYIKRTNRDLYGRTEYRIIEISSKLFPKQLRMKHKDRTKIINKDIFDWSEVVQDKHFFLAFEVFDNFSHDVLKYNIHSDMPYQGYVAIDKNRDFKEFFNPNLDKWCTKYLELRKDFVAKPKELTALNQVRNYMWPFRNKLSVNSEFIPTKLLEFFYILKTYFPHHQLISSDFATLPNAIPNSYNGPVVQTFFQKSKEVSPAKTINKTKYQFSRIKRDKMVTVSTYMVNQGYFDIMFPTNFELMAKIYNKVTGKSLEVNTHRKFMQAWSESEKTQCANGENPMLDYYKNVKFMCGLEKA